jgi:hypothetical protein
MRSVPMLGCLRDSVGFRMNVAHTMLIDHHMAFVIAMR